ncbi:MAG: hypothetical protein QM754_11735 [Tepidisphaeraceae bacterium]
MYAELAGFAASQDAYAVTDPDPTGHSYGKAIENALKDAKLTAADVSLLVPNGTGIPAADKAELKGIAKAFGDAAGTVPIAATKAQTGNLAAGCGVDAAVAVLSIAKNKIPPSVNTASVIDGVKLNVSPTARDAEVKVAVTSVASLGGQNAALVFKAI